MLRMARCSSQSAVFTFWVSHWPQMPPGRHINITNKASRTLGSGKNPEDRLLFSKRQGLQGSCHTSPWICKLYLAPKQHQPDQPSRVCTAKGSMVDTTEMLQDIHWHCQHLADCISNIGAGKQDWWILEVPPPPWLHSHWHQVNTRWLSQYHKSPSFPFPVIPSALLSSVILTTGNSPFSQRNQGLEWPHWGCGCCTHPWDFLFTSSKISTFGVGHAPQVCSVDDG